jgi:hypothetical protein
MGSIPTLLLTAALATTTTTVWWKNLSAFGFSQTTTMMIQRNQQQPRWNKSLHPKWTQTTTTRGQQTQRRSSLCFRSSSSFPHTLAMMIKASSSAAASSTRSKQQRQPIINNLLEWAPTVGIQISPTIGLEESRDAGIGWTTIGKSTSRSDTSSSSSSSSSLSTALTVECPGSGPNNAKVKVNTKEWPWFVQMAVYLYTLQQQHLEHLEQQQQEQQPKITDMDYGPWLAALPKALETPIHWSSSSSSSLLLELQYSPMIQMVEKQRAQWTQYHTMTTQEESYYPHLTFPEFVHWCEMAKSRGFSGSYSGSAFDPKRYAFTLLLITVYVGLNLGTLEQAANGATVVLAVSILKGNGLSLLYCVSGWWLLLLLLLAPRNHSF